MSETREHLSLRHQETGEDYPLEWARRIELALDKGQARVFLYGGLFGVFVVCVVAVALASAIADAPPL